MFTAITLALKIVKIVAVLVLGVMIIHWLLSSPTDASRFKPCFKKHYRKKATKIDNKFGKGTWKKFIKNDLSETQRVVEKVLSKKLISSEEQCKLRDLVDEMETYIENNIEYSPTTELGTELELLRKINAQNPRANSREEQLNQATVMDCNLKVYQDLQDKATTFYFGVIIDKKSMRYYCIYYMRLDDLESDIHTLLSCIREDISEDIRHKNLFEGRSAHTRKLFCQVHSHLSGQESLRPNGANEKEIETFIKGLSEIYYEYPELQSYFE